MVLDYTPESVCVLVSAAAKCTPPAQAPAANPSLGSSRQWQATSPQAVAGSPRQPTPQQAVAGNPSPGSINQPHLLNSSCCGTQGRCGAWPPRPRRANRRLLGCTGAAGELGSPRPHPRFAPCTICMCMHTGIGRRSWGGPRGIVGVRVRSPALPQDLLQLTHVQLLLQLMRMQLLLLQLTRMQLQLLLAAEGQSHVCEQGPGLQLGSQPLPWAPPYTHTTDPRPQTPESHTLDPGPGSPSVWA